MRFDFFGTFSEKVAEGQEGGSCAELMMERRCFAYAVFAEDRCGYNALAL